MPDSAAAGAVSRQRAPLPDLPSGREATVTRDMPHWIALLAIVLAAWMILAVVGGWLIGRGLGAIERHSGHGNGDVEPDHPLQDTLRRAA